MGDLALFPKTPIARVDLIRKYAREASIAAADKTGIMVVYPIVLKLTIFHKSRTSTPKQKKHFL
jgi:hypothetical protein